jgi:predicted DNA-binding transcriptional regulator AlpA
MFQTGAKPKSTELLTDVEARALLRMSRTTLWRLRRGSSIPFSKVGGRYLYSRAELLRWIRRSASREAAE